MGGEGRAKGNDDGLTLVILRGIVINGLLNHSDELIGRLDFGAAVWRVAGCHCHCNTSRISLHKRISSHP